MKVENKIPKAYICQGKSYMPETFVLVKDVSDEIILEVPWIVHIYPITLWDENGVH